MNPLRARDMYASCIDAIIGTIYERQLRYTFFCDNIKSDIQATSAIRSARLHRRSSHGARAQKARGSGRRAEGGRAAGGAADCPRGRRVHTDAGVIVARKN